MTLPKHLILAAIAAIMALASCGGSGSSASEALREAEAATALGDMEAARSVAMKITDENLSQLSAKDLARLSLVYMQIADSTDRENSIASATDLYRRAFEADPDSAQAYYGELGPDYYPYVALLKTLTGKIDNPYNPLADSIDHESDAALPAATDSI